MERFGGVRVAHNKTYIHTPSYTHTYMHTHACTHARVHTHIHTPRSSASTMAWFAPWPLNGDMG